MNSVTRLSSVGAEEVFLRRIVGELWEADHDGIPSFHKCSGRGKLLGEWMVPALCECFSYSMGAGTQQELSGLTVLLRTSVVVTDHLDDEWLTTAARELLLDSRSVLNRSIQAQLLQIDHRLLENWYATERLSRWALENFTAIGYEAGVVVKNMAAYIPVHVVGRLACASEERVRETLQFVSAYLYALQIVDDWQDREHDETARIDHNYFRFTDFPSSAQLPSPVSQNLYGLIIPFRRTRSDVVRSFVENGLRKLRLAAEGLPADLSIDSFHAPCQ